MCLTICAILASLLLLAIADNIRLRNRKNKEGSPSASNNSACTPLSNMPEDTMLCFCKGDFAVFKGVCGNCGKVIDITLSV